MEKKKVFVVLCCIVLLLVIGVSYAYWSLTFTQTGNNLVTTDCFEIEFIEGNAINLSKAYPVSDSDGMKNTPYTFTIKNVCDGGVSYQINLETLTPSGKKLSDQYLKIDLMEENVSKITSKLESSLNTEPTIEGALSAYQLLVGDLGPNETKEFSLRIWMHSDVTAMDKDSMNAVYHGKISVITSYNHIPTLSDYVRFNNELWRIIGLVNTPEGQRVKLIRNESIGRYSWDTSDGRINSGNGINEWSQADALRLLNSGYDSLEWGGSLYYNRRSGRCYIGNQNYLSACNFSSNGLLDQSKGMVDAITWNTGANGTIEGVYIKMMDYYDLERSSNTGDICARGCDKSVARTTSWKGQVGLMYPSDYAYATSGGTTTNRTNCLNSTSWGFKSVSDCKNNDWLYYSGNQWMLMPFSSSFDNSEVSEIRQDGSVNSSHAYSDLWVRPVVYLKNEVQVTKGDGSNQNPYQLFYKVN